MSQTQHDFASPNSDLNLYDLGQSYFDDAFFDPVATGLVPLPAEHLQHNTQDNVSFFPFSAASALAPAPVTPLQPQLLDRPRWIEWRVASSSSNSSVQARYPHLHRSAPFVTSPSKLRNVVCSSDLAVARAVVPATPAADLPSPPATVPTLAAPCPSPLNTLQHRPLLEYLEPVTGLSTNDAHDSFLSAPETLTSDADSEIPPCLVV